MNTANTENLMPTIVTFDVPEYRDRNWQAEYDAYIAQIKRDEYGFGPFSEGAR